MMMRRRHLVLLVVALAAVMVIPGSAATATEASTRFHGEMAYAQWATTDTSGITTAVVVIATEETLNSPLGDSGRSQAMVAIYQGEGCGAEACPPPMIQLNGYCTLPDGAFDVTPNISNAYLTGTFNCHNPSPRGPYDFSVTLDLAWQGTGEIERDHGSVHSLGDDMIFNWHVIGTGRSATATGSAGVNGQSLPLANLLEASLANSREGAACIADSQYDCPPLPSS